MNGQSRKEGVETATINVPPCLTISSLHLLEKFSQYKGVVRSFVFFGFVVFSLI